MLKTFDTVAGMIKDGKLLHISGTEVLLRKLPKGKWIGGSSEYFMAKEGGKVSGELLFATEIACADFSIKTYGEDICNIATDAFANGFTIVILPFDSEVHKVYAENAANYENMFLRNIAGWISGVNLGKPGQTPIAVNGMTLEAYSDKAAALHIKAPEGKKYNISILNIFEQDDNSPTIEFAEEGFVIKNCLVDGKETRFADYIAQKNINTKLPLVGDYSGNGINVSFKSVENGIVNFYAPVFAGVQYKMAKCVGNYVEAFHNHLDEIKGVNAVFSCNCILNFLYGEMEGKQIDTFAGPITFGEIAYQLLNQTMVYIAESQAS